MKRSAYYLTFATSILLLGSGCTQIKLNKGNDPGNSTGSAGAPPPVNGDWTITFLFNDDAFASNVTFVQKGKALVGQGTDQATGSQFFIENGSVNGTKVHFTKKYADMDPNRQPVDYNGEMEYQNDAEFHGWKMGGRYRTAANGKPIEDKWLAVPSSAVAEEAGNQGPPPEQQAPDPNQVQEEAPAPAPQPISNDPPPNAPNLSGQWMGHYTYDFKKITSKIWIEQDGGNLRGHGTDVNTNEKFNIEKGWYKFPKVTLKCKYTKGQSAASTREITIKAQVKKGPALKGETSLGGAWQATLQR